MTASAAQRDHFVEFIFAPKRGGMFCNLIMTEMARKPAPTAFEFQRDDVDCAVIMRAARFRIDIDAANLETVDRSSHAGTRSRGQARTSTDAMIQQTIIITNPLANEPLCWLRLPTNFGPKNPAMLAVQLINPTAAAAPPLVRNSEGKVKNAGK